MEPFELFQKIQQSEGMRIHWRMEALQASYVIFSGNLEDMLGYGGLVEQLYGSPKAETDEKKLALRMAHRLLHNFLAGAVTLIDHTRVLVRELYTNTPFYVEYEAEKQKSFVDAPIAGFIKGMRNWMVHRGPVPLCVVSTLDISADQVAARLMLDVKELQTWNGWDSRGRSLLAGLEKQTPLEDLLLKYAAIVEAFYEWFRVRLNDLHPEAFAALNEMQAQYKDIIAKQEASAIG